jgi:hypothetical protein
VTIFHPGDEVRYSDAFVAQISTTAVSPWFDTIDEAMAHALKQRGHVTSVRPMGAHNQYVRLTWENGDTAGVLASNLALVKRTRRRTS